MRGRCFASSLRSSKTSETSTSNDTLFLCPFFNKSSNNKTVHRPPIKRLIPDQPMNKILLSLLCLSSSFKGFAQEDTTSFIFLKDTTKRNVATANTNNPYVPNNIPPSANAASLGKYGDSPVSYYTGLASTGVQLYTIVSKDLSLPL